MIRTTLVHSIALLVAGAASAAPIPGALPSPEPLRVSRAEAVALAVAGNPAVAAAVEQVAQARARVAEATALPDAAIATTLEQENGLLQPRSATAKDIGLALTLPFPDKLRLSGKVAGAALRSAELGLTQLRQQIAFETAQAYDAVLVAARHRDDLREARTLAQDFLAKTEARFRGGTVARLDVLKARVDLAQADTDLITNERAVATARAGLNRLLARPLGAPIEPADVLSVPPHVPDLETLETLALASRPEIQSLAADRAGARDATTLARRYWLPDLSVTLSRNFTAGSPAAFSTAASVTIPLFFRQHEKGFIAEARHREAELAATAGDLAAQVDLDVRTAFAAATTALRQAAFLRDDLLPEAGEAYRIAAVSYGLGGSSALDLLDAKRTMLEARSQYTDVLGAANDALADLERAVGAPLPAPSGETHDQ
ncbi:MAG: TolC family protein [Thermoanaerobaculaceae bacterium]|nr:TolC family protein [Thermoanaerobaculaceae bacterium]